MVTLNTKQAESIYSILSLIGMKKILCSWNVCGVRAVSRRSHRTERRLPGLENAYYRLYEVRETYQKLFDTTPNIMVIHAGLGCGLFKKLHQNMDMVSIKLLSLGRIHPMSSAYPKRRLLLALLAAYPRKKCN
ncbi:MAG: hypothetical protein ACSLEL_00185 [Candidatus Malihini olakiniferum]